jgi:hypothetical protein
MASFASRANALGAAAYLCSVVASLPVAGVSELGGALSHIDALNGILSSIPLVADPALAVGTARVRELRGLSPLELEGADVDA